MTDERAAASLEKSARFYRIQAFALGGAIMGLAGAVQAHFIGFIAPDNYLPTLTFQVWTMLIVGGSGSNKGAITGSILVWAIWVGSGAVISMVVHTDQQALRTATSRRRHRRWPSGKQISDCARFHAAQPVNSRPGNSLEG